MFHLANAAVLGWSPVARARFFQRKRKSNPRVDNVEDGGRAIVIEEAIAAYMFAYARNHNYLEGVTSLDFHVLRTFRAFTEGLEVRRDNYGKWKMQYCRELRRGDISDNTAAEFYAAVSPPAGWSTSDRPINQKNSEMICERAHGATR